MDSWRTWDLVRPALERHHRVVVPPLVGHVDGPPATADLHMGTLADAIERTMDDAGIGTAHLVGNSLGGFVALQLAARGRARSVVAFAPAGGWAAGDESFRDVLRGQAAELVAELLVGAARCDAPRMLEFAMREGYELDAERIACPVRIVWGTEDRLLAWPSSAERFRRSWLPHADWIELEGAGHCPQLDVPFEAAELILGCTARSRW